VNLLNKKTVVNNRIYNDNNDFIQNNADHVCQYRIVICFRDHRSLRVFVSAISNY